MILIMPYLMGVESDLKKFVFYFVILHLFIFFIVSCNKQDKIVETKNNDEIIILGFSQIGSESSWRKANTESIERAAEKKGIKLIYSNANQNQENQIMAIKQFIAKQVDVIALSPIVESGWNEILIEAKKAKIPVIITDRNIETNEKYLYKTLIGADFYTEGLKAANWLIESNYYKNLEDKTEINIVEIKGNEGSSPTVKRKKGFEYVIKKNKNLKIIQSENGDFLVSKGKEVMENFLLTEKKRIDVVFAHNDDMALGAIEAIEEKGMVPGKDIIIISIDGTRAALNSILEGKLNCSIECNPLIGDELMEITKKIVKKDSVPNKIIIDDMVFTIKNAKDEIKNREY
ncbi:MAG: ABC transporter substrate-binding protein, partial [Clostridiales bacterium]